MENEKYSGGWVLYPPLSDGAQDLPWWASMLEELATVLWPAMFLFLIASIWAAFARRYLIGAAIFILTVFVAFIIAIAMMLRSY